MHACSEGLLSVQCDIEKGGRVADHCSLMTGNNMTVICRGGNEENGGGKKKEERIETDGSSLGLESGRC